MYESKFDDISASDCVILCMESLKQPLDGIKPKDPVMKYIYESAKVVKLLNPTPEYYASKKYRQELVAELTESNKFHDYEVERDISPSLNSVVRAQYDKLRSDCKSLDSTLMGGSVIVPYQGVIRSPRSDEEQKVYMREIINTLKNRHSPLDSNKKVKDIMECDPLGFMSGLDIDSDCLSTSSIMNRHISSGLDIDGDCLSLSLIMNRHISTESAKVLSEISAYGPEEVAVIEEIIFGDSLTIPITNTDTSLEAMENMANYSMDRLKDLVSKSNMLKPSADELSSNYDLQVLLNFMIQHPHFMKNDLASSIFLSENTRELTDIFYYGDMVIAEVENTYLVTPVMDISDGNIPKILCIDKENNISVASI